MSEIVYRVENEKRQGPFAARGMRDNWGTYFPSAEEIAEREAEYDREADEEGGGPYPEFDGMGLEPPFPNGRFGFANLEQLAHWFPNNGERGAIIADGFRVVAYTTSQLVKGRHQVYFCPTRLKRVVDWEEVP